MSIKCFVSSMVLTACLIGLETRCVVGSYPNVKSVKQVVSELNKCLNDCQLETSDFQDSSSSKNCVINCVSNAEGDLRFHALAE